MVYAPQLESDEKAHKQYCLKAQKNKNSKTVAGNGGSANAIVTASDKLLRPFYINEVTGSSSSLSSSSYYRIYCVPATTDPLLVASPSIDSSASSSSSSSFSKLKSIAEVLIAELGPASHPFARSSSSATNSNKRVVKYWLAFAPTTGPASDTTNTSTSYQLVGCLVTEPIKTAHRYYYTPKKEGSSSSSSSSIELDRSPSNTYEASLGVAQVWTSESHRRHGIAAGLLDAARENHLFGSSTRLSIEKVAFSQPTRYGKAFAQRYTSKAREEEHSTNSIKGKEKEEHSGKEKGKEEGGFFLVY
jgi:ESCO1/2 acetyl-transferase